VVKDFLDPPLDLRRLGDHARDGGARHARFRPHRPLLPPERDGDPVDQRRFDHILWPQPVTYGREQPFECRRLLHRPSRGVGRQPVPHGVLARDALAGRASRPGAQLRVTAISFHDECCLAVHDMSPEWLRKR